MLLVCSILQYTTVLYCLFILSCNLQRLYVACLHTLAIYNGSMLLVYTLLQFTTALCCMFEQSCNIQPPNIACHAPLALPQQNRNSNAKLEFLSPILFHALPRTYYYLLQILYHLIACVLSHLYAVW